MSTWPSLTKAYIAGVNASLNVRAARATPANLDKLPGFIRVTRGPGDDDTIFASQLIDFDVICPDYGDAEQMAEALRAWLLSTQNTVVGGVAIGQVRTASGPMEVDWGNPNVTRFVYSARISTRRT